MASRQIFSSGYLLPYASLHCLLFGLNASQIHDLNSGDRLAIDAANELKKQNIEELNLAHPTCTFKV